MRIRAPSRPPPHVSPRRFFRVMDLSTEAVRAIAAVLGPHPGQATPSVENRRDPRVKVAGAAVIIPYPPRTGRKPVRVTVHDVSARGLGFAHADELYPGEWFILHLPRTADPDCPRALLCSVMHSRPAPAGGFFLGAAFVCAVQPVQGAPRPQSPVIPTQVLEPALTLPGPDPTDPEVQELRQLLARGGMPAGPEAA
jgi:hypothetical protein